MVEFSTYQYILCLRCVKYFRTLGTFDRFRWFLCHLMVITDGMFMVMMVSRANQNPHLTQGGVKKNTANYPLLLDKCFKPPLGNQYIYPKTKHISKHKLESKLKKRFSYYCIFSNMLFDQKFPVYAVPGTGRWHKHTIIFFLLGGLKI